MLDKIIRIIRAASPVCLLTYILLSFSSCIKEDMEECLPVNRSLTVSFTYAENNRAYSVIDMDELKKAILYVYDENDDYVAEWPLDNPAFNNEYETGLKLAPGTYNVVVWFNPEAPYQVLPVRKSPLLEGKTCRSESQLLLMVPEDGCIRDTLPMLLHGSKEKVIIKENTGNQYAIPMTLNNNIINLTVNGLPVNDHTYGFTISDNNGHYTFDNNFVFCDPFNYEATMTFPAFSKAETSDAALSTSLTVLKLAGDRSPLINLQNQTTGEQLYPVYNNQTGNLVDLILKANPDNDFERTNIYDIVLDFNTDMTVAITVNGWRVKESDNEIFPG